MQWLQSDPCLSSRYFDDTILLQVYHYIVSQARPATNMIFVESAAAEEAARGASGEGSEGDGAGKGSEGDGPDGDGAEGDGAEGDGAEGDGPEGDGAEGDGADGEVGPAGAVTGALAGAVDAVGTLGIVGAGTEGIVGVGTEGVVGVGADGDVGVGTVGLPSPLGMLILACNARPQKSSSSSSINDSRFPLSLPVDACPHSLARTSRSFFLGSVILPDAVGSAVCTATRSKLS
jgi:hypothetical protein